METRKTALERAFELAKSGKYFSVLEIEKRLKIERLDVSHLEGAGLRKQLLKLIHDAKHD